MKKIIFSHHALNKIQILRNHQVFVDENLITKIISKPDRIESGYKNRLVAQGMLDDKHVLRFVYEEFEEEIKIITMYPARRSRYEKD
ncbi:DUF4258 domain-containing protein [Ignavibacteria bacterium 4148-Me]|uniref:DUF4258 domain-containing protein n=1 Tax=Rosettibacter primus TaxID=3111523 RepID=UPI00336BDE10